MNGDPDPRKRGSAPGPSEDAGSQAFADALRSSFAIVKFVMGVLVVVFFVRGFFIVGPQEQAIILRFGNPVGEVGRQLLGPGLHWSLPYPIDKVIKVPITEIQSVQSTTGWYAVSPQEQASGQLAPALNSLRPGVDGYVLTADRNIVHTRATLYFRVRDPIRFLFDYATATNVIRDALDDALIYTAGRFPVDDILYRDIAGFREAVRRRVNALIESEQVGVVVDRCDVDSTPPRWLANAFNQVYQAEINRDKALQVARSDQTRILSQALADAASLTNAAEAMRTNLVKEAKGDADRFRDLLPKYEANPGLFVQQRLLETSARVLTNVETWVQPSLHGTSRELWLQLNREPPKQKSAGQ